MALAALPRGSAGRRYLALGLMVVTLHVALNREIAPSSTPAVRRKYVPAGQLAASGARILPAADAADAGGGEYDAQPSHAGTPDDTAAAAHALLLLPSPSPSASASSTPPAVQPTPSPSAPPPAPPPAPPTPSSSAEPAASTPSPSQPPPLPSGPTLPPGSASLTPLPSVRPPQPYADPLVVAGADGARLALGRRAWVVRRPPQPAEPAPPAPLPPLGTAVMLYKRNSLNGVREWPVLRALKPGEAPPAVIARLATEEPALMATHEWRGNATAGLLPADFCDAVRKTPTIGHAGMLAHPSVRLWWSVAPVPGQGSPYAWPRGPPAMEVDICERVMELKLQISYASEACIAKHGGTSRFKRWWLDRAMPEGGNRPIDMRLPPWHRPVGIVTVSNALVSAFYAGSDAFFVTAGNATLSGVAAYTPLRPDAPVLTIATAATIGLARYLHMPGHFVNENLPRLVLLDALVPADVPLLYPSPIRGFPNSFPVIEAWLEVMTEAGSFGRGRRFLNAGSYGHVWRVGTLYSYVNTLAPPSADALSQGGITSAEDPSMHASFVAQNAMADRLRVWAARLLGRLPPPAPGDVPAAVAAGTPPGTAAAAPFVPLPPTRIVVMRRHGVRAIVNTDAMEAALAAAWPGVVVEAFEPALTPGYTLRASLLAIANASVVVAPHGAGNANLFPLAPGAAVIEVGPSNGVEYGRGWQAGYNNLCRVLGVRYWYAFAPAPPATGGGAAGTDRQMLVDVPEIVGLVGEAIRGEREAAARAATEAADAVALAAAATVGPAPAPAAAAAAAVA
jgi:hypothetical protein